jgi:hypothetical protein
VLARLLSERTVLVLPNVSGFQQTDSDLIKSFVEQGGVVVAFGPQIPMGRSYERKELFGADEAGLENHMALAVKEAVGERVKAGSRFDLSKTQLPGWTINKARVIATFEDDSPAIIANRFGKGLVISFFPDAWAAARDFPDLMRDVIDYALGSAGADSPVDIIGGNENIDVAVSKTASGFSVALVNHNSSKLEVVMRPTKSLKGRLGNWVDLVAGNTIETLALDRSVKLTVPGHGFRAIEFR